MHRQHARVVLSLLALGLSLFLSVPFSVSLAQTITSSGLNTTVSAPIVSIPSGKIQLNITDGTRPGGGANLFHSFGEFNVPTNTTANFLNNTGLPTSNILGRVTGGNLSSIYGTIQTTGFGSANLFLMNPAGFLFGPNATVNVGGMVSFTSADYLRLADGVRFNAVPNASADALLSTTPVAAFGFLGSNPGAITVQGSQLTVTEGTGISLVGGNITVEGGTLTAPSGQVNLVSVGSPSKPNVGGEVVIAGLGQSSGFTTTGFRTLGTITLAQGSIINTSEPANHGGTVLIRAGQFVMDSSGIFASGGTIEVRAEEVDLSNGSGADTSADDAFGLSPGKITFNANTFSASNSSLGSSYFGETVNRPIGVITIQGLQGSGTNAHAVSLTNTTINTDSPRGTSGTIRIRGDNISLNQSTLSSFSDFSTGGAIDLQGGNSINLTDTFVNASAAFFNGNGGGPITLSARSVSLNGSVLRSNAEGGGGRISITGSNSVSLNDTSVSANAFDGRGGDILINGGALFTSQQSSISSTVFSGSSVQASGGTIQLKANKIALTDTQVDNSAGGQFSGLPPNGGTITVDAKNLTLNNSQMRSTGITGNGGTIDITSPRFYQDAISVIDASSQFGTNGTVTINGVVQP
jgi:filamentous hemagglutinin family protein